MSKTTFSGPVRTGNDTGSPATRTVGTVIAAQRVTVNAQNSAGNHARMVIPSGSDIIDYLVDVETPFAAGVMVTAHEFSILHGATLVTNVVVSASGRYDAIASGTKTNSALLRNVTTTVEAFVSTQSLASAATVGQAMLTVKYVQN